MSKAQKHFDTVWNFVVKSCHKPTDEVVEAIEELFQGSKQADVLRTAIEQIADHECNFPDDAPAGYCQVKEIAQKAREGEVMSTSTLAAMNSELFARPWTKEQDAKARAELHAMEWYQTRPEHVRKVIDQCPPYFLYQMNTGHNAFIYSYTEHEDDQSVTLTVTITNEWNAMILMERRVFGVLPSELTPIRLADEKS
jgi:hypothetical protein